MSKHTKQLSPLLMYTHWFSRIVLRFMGFFEENQPMARSNQFFVELMPTHLSTGENGSQLGEE